MALEAKSFVSAKIWIVLRPDKIEGYGFNFSTSTQTQKTQVVDTFNFKYKMTDIILK